MKIRIVNHDGSVHVCTPQVDFSNENRFGGDVKGLVETVSRKAFPSTNPSDMPGGKLYKYSSVS